MSGCYLEHLEIGLLKRSKFAILEVNLEEWDVLVQHGGYSSDVLGDCVLRLHE